MIDTIKLTKHNFENKILREYGLFTYLEFQCYEYNRDHHPHIKPETFSFIFPMYEELEKMYQEKQKLTN